MILTFREMVAEIQAELTTTLAATEIGRMLQLFSAVDIKAMEELAFDECQDLLFRIITSDK